MLTMPEPDQAVLARRAAIVAALRRIVPGEGVIESEAERRVYESDGLTAYRTLPMVVVLPETTAQVAAVLRFCSQEGVKVVPRGAGTSLSGGALPLADGVLLGLGKFKRILEVDIPNRCAVVQPGVTNLGITHAVQEQGFYYAPDPSSQIACTIGGNVAENSGGVHCLKYGLTTNNVIGLVFVTMDGEVIRLGGKHFDSAGLRPSRPPRGLRRPPRRRHRSHRPHPPQTPGRPRPPAWASPPRPTPPNAVASVIAAGIIPGGMEMMDRLATEAAEAFVHAGYDARRRRQPHRRARRLRRRSRPPRGRRREPSPSPTTPPPCRTSTLRRRTPAFLGRPQSRLSRRSAASRPTISAWTAPFPRRRRRRRAGPHEADGGRTRPARAPTSFTPATATFTRSSSTMPTTPANSSAPKPSATTSSVSASKWAACSPASTASASKSAT